MSTADSVYRNYWNDFHDASYFNLENGEWGLEGSTDTVYGSVNALGMDNEGAVAGIWWDIYDGADDDYSDSTDWGTWNIGHGPDGIKDSLSDGPTHILATLLDDAIFRERPDNIEEFWDSWFTPKWSRHKKAMQDIWYEHGDSTKSGCCVGIRGNINGDPEEYIDIADLVFLIDYMFLSGPQSPCYDEANVEIGDPNIDISDLVFIVDYMFCGGPEPPPCL